MTSAITRVLAKKGLAQYISFDEIDKAPEERERGITIATAHVEYQTAKRHYAHVDCPGHADLIKVTASSVEIIDCALLVIDITKGPQIQTGEHLIMIEALNIRDIIVVLNKSDLFKGDITQEIEKTRRFLAPPHLDQIFPFIVYLQN